MDCVENMFKNMNKYKYILNGIQDLPAELMIISTQGDVIPTDQMTREYTIKMQEITFKNSWIHRSIRISPKIQLKFLTLIKVFQ